MLFSFQQTSRHQFDCDNQKNQQTSMCNLGLIKGDQASTEDREINKINVLRIRDGIQKKNIQMVSKYLSLT